MGQLFRASTALLVSAFMIFTFVVPVIAQEEYKLPDLTAEYVEVSLYEEEGNIAISWEGKLTNRVSGSQVLWSFRVSFYLSKDTFITPSDICIGDYVMWYLPSDFYEEVISSEKSYLWYFFDAPPGSYYVGMIVDVDGVIEELDEGNNTACTSKPVKIFPDWVGCIKCPCSLEGLMKLAMEDLKKYTEVVRGDTPPPPK